MKTIAVIGAAGDVGRGIVAAAAEKGWRVAAAGRRPEALAEVARAFGTSVVPVAGDLASEAGAGRLRDAIAAAVGGLDAVVVSVNAPASVNRLLDWTADDIAELVQTNLVTHFAAARAFLPSLPAQALYLGIGGGTADFLLPKMGHMSMVQAGLRMMYRALAKEAGADSAAIRELIVAAMVNGLSKRDQARPEWLTDVEIGRHVCAIVDDPARFPGPVLKLSAREQIGQPEPAREGKA